jgi:hypothetical protein
MELASICRRAHTELEGTAILSRSRGRDRWFESAFLQRRVNCELNFLDQGAAALYFRARSEPDRRNRLIEGGWLDHFSRRRFCEASGIRKEVYRVMTQP